MFWQLVLACIGSSGLSSLIIFLIQRKDERLSKIDEIQEELRQIQLDSTRAQLLMLIKDYPEQETEVLTLGKKYFVDLGGNFYMDSIFRKYLDNRNIKTPSWFFK